MAAKTWYLTNNSASIGSDLSDTNPGAEAYRSPVTGWIVGTGSTNHSEYYNDTERASSTFTGTTVPDGSLDTTNGDFWVSPSPISGNFASANWNVHFACRANTVGGAQDGRMRCRLFRGANQNGTSAVEITAGQQNGGLVTNLDTGATQVSTATFNPGAFSVTNEYIFVQLAWERTGAGGMTTSDVNVRIGNNSGTGSRVITSDFTIVVAVGQATETDTAQTVSRVKTKAIGQTTESDTAQAVARIKTKGVAQASETDTAQTVTSAKVKAIAQASETDAAQTVTRLVVQIIAVNQASETDLAQAMAHAKSKTVQQATETDSAQSVAKSKVKAVAQATETDLAQAVTRVKVSAIAQATETDLAQSVTASGNKVIAVSQAAETDLAQAISKSKVKAIAQASEADSAQTVTRVKTRTVAQATETDASQPVAHSKTKAVGQASETDLAQACSRLKARAIAQVAEIDASLSVTARKTRTIGQVGESDVAQAVTRRKTGGIGLALEIDTAQAIASLKSRTVGQAFEIDEAGEISSDIYVATPAGRTLAIGHDGTLRIGRDIRTLEIEANDALRADRNGAALKISGGNTNMRIPNG